jgi:hypothetical protein
MSAGFTLARMMRLVLEGGYRGVVTHVEHRHLGRDPDQAFVELGRALRSSRPGWAPVQPSLPWWRAK